MQALRTAVAFVVAVLVAEALAAAASAQFVLHELAALGVDVALDDRISMTLHDIAGMLPLYGTVIGVAFLIALPVAGFLASRLPSFRSPLFAAAGGTGIVVAILVLRQALDVTPIAGARTAPGLAVQGLAGAAAGYLFARLERVTRHLLWGR